jgi:hypothetical protein
MTAARVVRYTPEAGTYRLPREHAVVLSSTAGPDNLAVLMVDIKASSRVEENIGLPWGSYLYAIPTFHCMSVPLGLGGDGLGTVRGGQLAQSMLAEAGFGNVECKEVEAAPFNAYFAASA